jgi:AbrB family looped-hinge helix DNA binding protein
MNLAKKAATTVSTKGQVILPKAIREAKGWGSGTKLVVEETRDGVLLRPACPFPPTKPEDVFGSLDARGKHVKIEDFDRAIANEVRRRHARGRY